jgi:excisionase family DNA binding protein
MERHMTDKAKPVDLLEVDQVAAALGISRWSVYRWCSEGRIPCIRAGRKVRFELAKVIEALRDCGHVKKERPSFHRPPPPAPVTTTRAPSRPVREERLDPSERIRAAVDATRALEE